MSNLELLRQFIAECPLIDELTDNIHIDWTGGSSESFGIMPTGVTRSTIFKYIDGSKIVQVQEDFSIYCDNYTADDIQRLEQSNFTFRLMDYFEDKSFNEELPFTEDDAFLTAQNGSLFEIEEDGQFGKYLIQLNLIYKKEYKK